MRFHVIALPHTQTIKAFNSCAYTEKVRKFCRMMYVRGHEVYLYAGEQNEAPCTEHITCISEVERATAVGSSHYTSASFDISKPHWVTFNANAIREIEKRIQPRDFICLIAGTANECIARSFPNHLAVEFGIGYGGSFSNYRVWESYAWMHHCYGYETCKNGKDAHGCDGRWFDAVIPGYLETESFPVVLKKSEYLLYVGRMTDRKGINVAVQVAKACGRQLLMAGPGVPPKDDCVSYLGVVGEEKRAELMGNARALLAPTIYLEPFGNVAIEAMACGTPVISTDWGAFTETNIRGVTGFRCRMFEEFIEAVDLVGSMDFQRISDHAKGMYGLDNTAYLYEFYFKRLESLWGSGWYEGAHDPALQLAKDMVSLRKLN